MEIVTTDVPAKLAGEYISKTIAEHDGDTVCLLSGGSALDAIEFINVINKPECRTIFMMVDERVSGEGEVNNYLQLSNRYTNHLILDLVIKTIPEPNESENEFAKRIEKTFLQKLSELNNPKIIALLGVGNDGHTAGIFPMDKTLFQDTYRDDSTYVPVHVDSLKIDSRASFTPHWLLNNVSEFIGFGIGKIDKETIENLFKAKKEIHEQPVEIWKRHAHTTIITDQVIETS